MSQKIINYQMIIDGKYTNSITEKSIEVECPANRRIFATVPRGNEADVDIAVKSSLKAFRSWSKVMPKERGKILLQIADAIEIEKINQISNKWRPYRTVATWYLWQVIDDELVEY